MQIINAYYIYLQENEQRLSYHTETKMLHKDIQTLSKRLINLKEILQSVEDMELLPEVRRIIIIIIIFILLYLLIFKLGWQIKQRRITRR